MMRWVAVLTYVIALVVALGAFALPTAVYAQDQATKEDASAVTVNMEPSYGYKRLENLAAAATYKVKVAGEDEYGGGNTGGNDSDGSGGSSGSDGGDSSGGSDDNSGGSKGSATTLAATGDLTTPLATAALTLAAAALVCRLRHSQKKS